MSSGIVREPSAVRPWKPGEAQGPTTEGTEGHAGEEARGGQGEVAAGRPEKDRVGVGVGADSPTPTPTLTLTRPPVAPSPPRPVASGRPLTFGVGLRALGDPSEAPLRDTPEALLGRARLEAEALLQQARQEAQRVRAVALREGYADGQTRGFEEWAEQRQRLREQLGRIGEAFRTFCEAQSPELASLAAAAAERVLHEQLTLEPERVVTIVHRALEQVLASSRIIVHLNPDDLDVVRSRMPVLELRPTPVVSFQPDPGVERGGCWIETDQGQVEATLSGAVTRLGDALSSA